MRQDRIATVVLVGLAACVATPSHAKPLERPVATSARSLRTRRGDSRGRKLIPLEGFGAYPNAQYLPLGECQGDCDEDEDCKGNLVCFQRDPGDPVPGCEGGEEAMSKTDYCVVSTSITFSGTVDLGLYEESSSESQEESSPESPEESSSQESDSSPHYFTPEDKDGELPELVGYGGDPSADKIPLKKCQGDCDRDSDCEGSLTCYHRTVGWPVPGCNGNNEGGETDYCVQRTGTSASESIASTNEPALIGLGGDPPARASSLGECEGDCDTDDDCAGALICYQRDPGWPVPGCSGTSQSKTDFCVLHPTDRTDSTSSSSSHIFTAQSDSESTSESTPQSAEAAAVEQEEQSLASRRMYLPGSLITIAILSFTLV